MHGVVGERYIMHGVFELRFIMQDLHTLKNEGVEGSYYVMKIVVGSLFGLQGLKNRFTEFRLSWNRSNCKESCVVPRQLTLPI